VTASLPLLLLDIDGVLNPFAAPACPPGYTQHDIFPGEKPVRLYPAHGSWLQELATRSSSHGAPTPTGSSLRCCSSPIFL
jgi:hypothetical protein